MKTIFNVLFKRPKKFKNFNPLEKGEACPYAEACTFCYNREEEEIWTWERRGLFNRNRLFVEVIKDPLAHYMKQYGHHFYQSCKSCVDESQHDKCVCNHRQVSTLLL